MLTDIIKTSQLNSLDHRIIIFLSLVFAVILSAFTYTFTPVPDAMSAQWQENNVDILLLKNQLK